MADELEWNMWTRRDAPFYALAEGSQVFLVSGGGPRKGIVTFEVVVTRVVAAPYASKDEAWKLIRTQFAAAVARLGITRQGFLTHSYTAAGPDSGYILAWTYDPVRAIGLPRPTALIFRPNGWAEFGDLAFDGGATGAPPLGQGRLVDPVLRELVEDHAMIRAKAWLIAQGHPAAVIATTASTKPFDFAVRRRGADVLRVEVKGLTGGLGPVIVTRGEVDATRDGVPTVLFVVHGIEVIRDGTTWRTEGGVEYVVDPWLPDAGDLTVIDYRFDPRPLRT